METNRVLRLKRYSREYCSFLGLNPSARNLIVVFCWRMAVGQKGQEESLLHPSANDTHTSIPLTHALARPIRASKPEDTLFGYNDRRHPLTLSK